MEKKLSQFGDFVDISSFFIENIVFCTYSVGDPIQNLSQQAKSLNFFKIIVLARFFMEFLLVKSIHKLR